MTTYKVEICRVSYGFKTVTVSADSEAEAQEKALEQAGNFEYVERNADYSVEFMQEV